MDPSIKKSANMGSFDQVDNTNQADQFIAFLDRIERTPGAVKTRQRSYELLQTTPGMTAVDVGCGTGRAVSELYTLGLNATGIDNSEQMIAVAKSRFPQCDFRVGDASSLPFQDGSIDRYRAERLYQHLNDAVAALSEAYRILSPGGRIVLVDQDWDMAAIDAEDMELTRRILRAFSNSINNHWIGRQLRGRLVDAGFEDISVEVICSALTDPAPLKDTFKSVAKSALDAGTISQEEADNWLSNQEERAAAGKFFFCVPLFLASARKG